MPWIELAVVSRHPEFVEELLLAAGAEAVSQVDAADDPVLEPAPGATPLWPQTRTLGLFAAEVDIDVVCCTLTDHLPPDDGRAISRRVVADRDWVRVWLQHAHPLRFGERLWICPSGHAVEVPGAVVIDLDPGLAFGTGHHPSTALCLEWLASDAALRGCRVLDYGCGSGVLAIAALKLGASEAVATDIDPQALQATADNTAHNHVRAQLTLADPETLARRTPEPTFDRVLANILAGVLVELAPQLAGHVTTDGQLVLAGILERQATEVRKAFAPWFEFSPDGHREGWVRVVGRRRPVSR